MTAIINFLQQTGFYMFGQDGNGKCLIMIAISFILHVSGHCEGL